MKDVIANHHKGRRILTHLQESVEKFLYKLIELKLLIKLGKNLDKHFIILIVITVIN